MMNYNYDSNKVMDGDKALTKKEVFAIIRGLVADNDALVGFIDHEVALLSRERKASSKETAKKQANLELAQTLKGLLTTDGQTRDELAVQLGENISGQKVSSLFKSLVEGVDYTKAKVNYKDGDKRKEKTVYTAVIAD